MKNLFEDLAIQDLIAKDIEQQRRNTIIEQNKKAVTPILSELRKVFNFVTDISYEECIAIRSERDEQAIISICLEEPDLVKIGRWGGENTSEYNLTSLKTKKSKKQIFELFKSYFYYREEIKNKFNKMPQSVKFIKEDY